MSLSPTVTEGEGLTRTSYSGDSEWKNPMSGLSKRGFKEIG